MLQVEVVCDWCNVREVVRLDDPNETCGEWTLHDGAAWVPLGIELLEDPAGVEGVDILCPDCVAHVEKDGELQADDDEGWALYQARGGLYWHELKRQAGDDGAPPAEGERSEAITDACAFCGEVLSGGTPEAVHAKVELHYRHAHAEILRLQSPMPATSEDVLRAILIEVRSLAVLLSERVRQ